MLACVLWLSITPVSNPYMFDNEHHVHSPEVEASKAASRFPMTQALNISEATAVKPATYNCAFVPSEWRSNPCITNYSFSNFQIPMNSRLTCIELVLVLKTP